MLEIEATCALNLNWRLFITATKKNIYVFASFIAFYKITQIMGAKCGHINK